MLIDKVPYPLIYIARWGQMCTPTTTTTHSQTSPPPPSPCQSWESTVAVRYNMVGIRNYMTQKSWVAEQRHYQKLIANEALLGQLSERKSNMDYLQHWLSNAILNIFRDPKGVIFAFILTSAGSNAILRIMYLCYTLIFVVHNVRWTSFLWYVKQWFFRSLMSFCLRWLRARSFSCNHAALRTLLPVRPIVCAFVCDTCFTIFLSSYHHEIFSSHYH